MGLNRRRRIIHWDRVWAFVGRFLMTNGYDISSQGVTTDTLADVVHIESLRREFPAGQLPLIDPPYRSSRRLIAPLTRRANEEFGPGMHGRSLSVLAQRHDVMAAKLGSWWFWYWRPQAVKQAALGDQDD